MRHLVLFPRSTGGLMKDGMFQSDSVTSNPEYFKEP